MPGASAMNSGAPAASAPNFGATNPGDVNSAIPNQNAAKPITDAQARHDYEASTRTAMTLLNQGQLVEALRELSRWYGQAVVPPEDEPRLVALLGQLAGTVIYSRDPWLGPPYQVRAGDSVESIAQQYQVPWQLLAKINGIQNPNGLLPGEKLKIVHGPFQAQLNVRQGWLALFVDGLYAGRFPVQVAGSLVKPDGAYPVAKFIGDAADATSSRAPYISLGGDLHLRVPDDALPPGVNAVRISRQDMNEVFDMLSERSQVTIMR
jgi:LysM repeat protein